MSEEILKALTQLFAIITKQDGGVKEKEREFVIGFFKKELDEESVNEYLSLYDEFSGYGTETNEEEDGDNKKKLTSVRDSVKTLGLCRKINKTLTQKQKVVVLIKILELVSSDKNFTPQRMEIIDTISTVFNIDKNEYKLIESFVVKENSSELDFEDILVVDDEETTPNSRSKHLREDINGTLLFLRIHSVDMYFSRYIGQDEVVLNGFILQPQRVYLFSHGSTIKTSQGAALYYSDLVALFNEEIRTTKLSFNADIDEFTFPNGAIGLRDIHISEGPGRLIGIMGASGAGKTTLLNVLAGIEEPGNGKVRINGIDIHKNKHQVRGVIGYVSQDDLLIEELTVFDNLYYNAKLCFAKSTDEEIRERVLTVLASLGLDQRKDLKVGNPLDKTISGGQRKRLNIALELIREPAVLFVDEPTSGLSSRDSENVIDLLKELSLKGKLIFVVIHQPSSDIYKMFDKMYIMDTGGYPVFYGHPVAAVTYFKQVTNQVDSERGQCDNCGNVNPEQIFNIIEARVVDEYGQLTTKRKISPQGWHDHYKEHFALEKVEAIKEEPPQSLAIPSKIKQSAVFLTRDFLSKIANKQYLLINLLEAPLLALILAFIIRYKSSPDGQEYVFRFNENIPAFMLMSIIVALFMGLTVSAEEIIRDRKILKRESFLNLSWNSYLVSKLGLLFFLSAIQTLSFVLIGNWILEIKDMILPFWAVLFATSCFANVLGLNISSAFKSAVTVYIMIPLVLIPQMILSGLLFNFDRLNNLISTQGKVPVVADLMASRWAYEAMAVYQFKNNGYEYLYYDLEKKEAESDFKAAYIQPHLKEKVRWLQENASIDSVQQERKQVIRLLHSYLSKDDFREGLPETVLKGAPDNLTTEELASLDLFLEDYKRHYRTRFNEAVSEKEKKAYFFENQYEEYDLTLYKNAYFNESLADLVTNATETERLIEYDGELIQQINAVFHIPKPEGSIFNYRTHFFAPVKYFMGNYIDTFWFNVAVIWGMSVLLYLALYFEWFRKAVEGVGNISIYGKK